MATEVTLIRHGHAVRINGNYVHAPLTSLGRNQAARTGHFFCDKGETFDGFYCSPLRRAKETAALIGEQTAKIPKITQGIQELETSEVPQLVAFEVLARMGVFGQYLYRNAGKPITWPIVGRVSHVLSELVRLHPDQKIAVVSHSGVISAILAWYFPGKRRRWWRTTVDNCSLTRLLIDDSHAELVFVNDTNHLAPEITTSQPPAKQVVTATKAEQTIEAPILNKQNSP